MRDHMRDTVQFLEDHELLAGSSKVEQPVDSRQVEGSRPSPPTIFEPCVIIGDRSKLFIGEETRLDSFTKFEIGNGMWIGRGVHVASFAHVGIGGGSTFIGDYCAVASGGKLISGSNQLDAPSMSPKAPLHMFRITRGKIIMHNFSCVLTNAVVYPGVTLGFGAILMPNSTATKNIPDWEVWGGSPAKFLFKRETK